MSRSDGTFDLIAAWNRGAREGIQKMSEKARPMYEWLVERPGRDSSEPVRYALVNAEHALIDEGMLVLYTGGEAVQTYAPGQWLSFRRDRVATE